MIMKHTRKQINKEVKGKIYTICEYIQGNKLIKRLRGKFTLFVSIYTHK
jgi:hypothetical protein